VVELGPVGDLGAGHAGPLGVDVAHCRLLVQPVELQAAVKYSLKFKAKKSIPE
jgi:hypothetical protein